MFDFLSLVGDTTKVAIQKLKDSGFQKIKIEQNLKQEPKCDTQLVCSAKLLDSGEVKLVVGEFCINVEEK